jgi:two-component system sensor histidine kinase BaeS
MRRRFMVRLALFFTAMVLLVGLAVGLVALLWHAGSGRRAGPVFGAIVLLVLIIAMVGRGVGRLAGPVGDVMEAADRVAGGDYDVRVPERGSREVRRLGRAFNRMTERLGSNEERRRNLLADVTHELRTPLAVIRANLEGLVDGMYPLDRDHLAPILDETVVMSRLLEDLQTLSTAEAGALTLRRERVTPAELVEEAVAGFRATGDEHGISLSSRVSEGLPEISVDPVRIAEVFANLLSNAVRHTPSGGSIVVAVDADAAGVAFTVMDTGSGIPEGELPHIFDRFARGAGSSGAGLGLAIAKSLVEAHGGTIGVSRPDSGEGTTIRVVMQAS